MIYALHAGDGVYRYVGSTSKNSKNRLYEHIYRARSGHPSPVYMWMREVGTDHVQVVDLVKVEDDSLREVLEAATIAHMIKAGHPLTNRMSRDGTPGSMAEESKRLIGEKAHGRPTWIKGKTGEDAGWTDARRRAQSDRIRARFAA